MSRLLLRLCDPDFGEVKIGGVDIRKMNIQNLQKIITIIGEKTYIFEGSLAENINFGSMESLHRPDAQEKIRQVSEQSFLNSFIQSLPNGVQSTLSESGKNLPRGVRQLIGIARALRQDTPIIGIFSHFLFFYSF